MLRYQNPRGWSWNVVKTRGVSRGFWRNFSDMSVIPRPLGIMSVTTTVSRCQVSYHHCLWGDMSVTTTVSWYHVSHVTLLVTTTVSRWVKGGYHHCQSCQTCQSQPLPLGIMSVTTTTASGPLPLGWHVSHNHCLLVSCQSQPHCL
jgi:hypothetical protein